MVLGEHGEVTSPSAAQPGWLLPVVAADQALRRPDAAVTRIQAARLDRGLSAAGTEYPRRRWWGRVVLPMAALDIVAVATLAGTGSAGAGVAVAGLSATVLGMVVLIRGDPLRIGSAVRRKLAAVRVWRSGHSWVPPLSETPERAQLGRAQQAVRRIAETTWWQQDLAADAPLGPDLIDELDGVDDQAFRLAVLPPDDPAGADLRGLLEGRVQALEALAQELERYDSRTTGRQLDGEPPLEAVVGGVLDQDAADRVRALTQAVRESPTS